MLVPMTDYISYANTKPFTFSPRKFKKSCTFVKNTQYEGDKHDPEKSKLVLHLLSKVINKRHTYEK